MMMCRYVVMVAASIVMMFMSMLMIEYILSIMIQDVDNCYKYFVVMMMGYHSMGQYQYIEIYKLQRRRSVDKLIRTLK